MTINELKEAINDYREKNTFDFERRTDEISEKLFHINPENFEIIKNEKTGKLYVVPATNDFSLLFRGQAKEINPCLPTLHRKSPTPLQIFIERLRYVEFEHLLDGHPLVKLYKEKGLTLSPEGLAQHYGLKTEVMDFTSDIDVALFFAMCPYDAKSDSYVLPKEEDNNTGIIYVLNPYIYDPALKDNNVDLFSETVQPIGLQPFERPGAQKGYGLHLPSGKKLEHIKVFDFEYTMDEANEYHKRYTEQSVLWIKDELIKPVKQLSEKTVFAPSIFKETWKRFPVEGLTKSQCNKQIGRDYGIQIKQNATLTAFNKEEIVDARMSKRWNSYYNRVLERKLLSFKEGECFKEHSPVMTTEVLANLQMLRMAQSALTFPKNTRPQSEE